jgi:GR25 family glycosyltransferase involved in LPS biosynthesis
MLNIYNKLNVGAYKADFFRALYLYINSGLYFDCKNVLFCNINNILDKNESYVEDLYDGIYNGFLYCNYIKKYELKNYICEMIFNIYKSLYLSSILEITGPQLLNKFIKNNIFLKKYNGTADDWKNSYLVNNNNNNIIIKNSYYDYYDENNYLITNHYAKLYHEKKVYNEINIPYNKINKINLILWINLERSVNRKDYMENLLSNINVPNMRINAIDGRNENIKNMIKTNFEKENITNYEIACCLSHIKAINHLNNIDGDYFIICEDDILFNNLILFNIDLDAIISNGPNFDILIINKTYYSRIENMYENWNSSFTKGPDYHIAGTGCYIISRNGINKTINNTLFIDDENFIFNSNKNFDVADKYIYKDLETYVYKYNFCGNNDEESTIHSDHIENHIKSSNFQIREIINDLL